MGNVQLLTELLNYRSVELFAVLSDLTFPVQTLIGYRTMKRRSLILDCEREEISVKQEFSMTVSNLKTICLLQSWPI